MLHVVGHTREKSLRFNPQNCEKSPDMRVHRGSIREMRWSPFCCIPALWTLLITALIITFWRVWWLTETTEYHKVRRPWPEDTWLMCGCDSLRGWRRGVDSWRMMMWQRWSDVTTPCRFIILKQPPRENGVRFKTDENKVGRWQTEEKLHANVATGSTLGEPSSKIKTCGFNNVGINYFLLNVNMCILSNLLIWDCVRTKLNVFPRRGFTVLFLCWRSFKMRLQLQSSESEAGSEILPALFLYFRPPD